MGLWSWSRVRVRVLTAAVALAGVALALVLTLGAGSVRAAGAAVPAKGSESPAVAAELARIVRGAAPLVSEQGGQGGTGPAPAVPGTLVPGLSTAMSDTYRTRRGPLVTRIYSSPVNYRDAQGAWHAIDNSLVPAGGGFANAANSFSLPLPPEIW